MAFSAEVEGPGIDPLNDVGLWYYNSTSGTSNLIFSGDAALRAGEFFNGGVSRLSINATGAVAFGAGVYQSGQDATTALFTLPTLGGGLTEIARLGDSAPGTGLPFRFFDPLTIDNLGHVTFTAEMSGSNAEGIWRSSASEGLELVAADGNAAPGTGASFTRVETFVVDDLGRLFFRSGLSSIDSGLASGVALWRDGPSGPELVGKRGDRVAGIDGAIETLAVSRSPSTRDGDLYFNARIRFDDGTSASSHWVIGSDGMPTLRRLFDASVTAPGTTSQFDGVSGQIVNAEGDIAYGGSLIDGIPNGGGIWNENANGDTDLVVRVGFAVPGTSFPLVNLSGNYTAFNDLGQTAFQGTVRENDPGNPRPTTLDGIWAESLSGELELIALEGQQIDVSDDGTQPDLRTIVELEFLYDGFNNLGQLLFEARFDDGSSAILISNAVAVPEPTTIGLMGCGLALVKFGWRSKRSTRS